MDLVLCDVRANGSNTLLASIRLMAEDVKFFDFFKLYCVVANYSCR
jgi:hypothetical protein